MDGRLGAEALSDQVVEFGCEPGGGSGDGDVAEPLFLGQRVGTPPARDTHALIVGYNSARDAAPYFARCRRLATVNDRVGLNNNEQGLPLLLCRPTAAWTALWPRLTHYD
jgi:hypothetical protein